VGAYLAGELRMTLEQRLIKAQPKRVSCFCLFASVDGSLLC
jgi:hypothetical protein